MVKTYWAIFEVVLMPRVVDAARRDVECGADVVSGPGFGPESLLYFPVGVGFRFGVGLGFGVLRWHPLYVFGLLALPLCGAAVTFFAAAKKVTKESGFQPPVPARITLQHTFFELSRSDANTP
ncbi:hypothetical protein [Paraburkholderia azotifigens]|uniref:hypothetical protein n=1 Tax=Paraburkholderia azotifigens TaxID=2057004 RepID=UPI0013159434|nr:hypothetical protein [Paraburkholderia azotifigens]